MTEMQKKIIESFDKFFIGVKSLAENKAYSYLCDNDSDTLFLLNLSELMDQFGREINTISRGADK